MFSLAYNLPKTTSKFGSSKFRRKKYLEAKWIFRPSKLRWKKWVEKPWIFLLEKLHGNKYVETSWIFWPTKLHRKRYVETTWIFWPSKLHRKKYVETTWIFDHQNYIDKSTWKWRGNLSKFGLRRIEVISMSNRHRREVPSIIIV